MGFFSFIKDAGEKLFGHKEAEATAAAAAVGGPTDVSTILSFTAVADMRSSFKCGCRVADQTCARLIDSDLR